MWKMSYFILEYKEEMHSFQTRLSSDCDHHNHRRICASVLAPSLCDGVFLNHMEVKGMKHNGDIFNSLRKSNHILSQMKRVGIKLWVFVNLRLLDDVWIKFQIEEFNVETYNNKRCSENVPEWFRVNTDSSMSLFETYLLVMHKNTFLVSVFVYFLKGHFRNWIINIMWEKCDV